MIMNKRFSTLLAAALVAGGLSFNANAAVYGADDVKDGSFIHLGETSGSSDVLAVTEDGKFDQFTIAASNGWDGNIKNLLGTLWQVKKTAHTSSAGVQYTYSFVNRLSGQLLSIKLETTDGTGRSNIEANEKDGQTDWAWDQTAGLYCVKNFGAGKDTTYTIGFDGSGIQLSAEAGIQIPTTSATALTQIEVSEDEVTLTADDFNALVKKEGGRLFFTDENVSSDAKNVLTDNKWEAVDAVVNDATGAYDAAGGGKSSVLYLTNGKEYKNRMNDAMTDADKTQKEYLLVDYSFYDPRKEFNVLKTDTIAVEPASAVVANFDNRTVISKHHPATAAFTVTYYIPNDSMVIAPKFVQTSIPVAATLDAQYALITGAPGDAGIAAITTAVGYVKAAVAAFAADGNAGTFVKGTKFAEIQKFDATGTFNGSGAKTGKDLIDEVKSKIKALTAEVAEKDAVKVYVAAVNAYLNKLNGLEIAEASTGAGASLSTSAVKDGENYVDGLNDLTVEAVTPAKQVVIRKLYNTKVLTIGEDPADPVNGNLVATIKTSDKEVTMGGDAEIAEGIYYVIDAKKGEDTPNKRYGKYYDYSPVNAAGFVSKAQAFNPFAQFVVSKAAGVDKGNYSIDNRGDENEGWYGVTNVVDKDNNIFAIGGDTIQLVAAEGVDKDNAYIGYKYMTANDAKNNKFTITSAAEMLAGQSIIMKSDSALAVGAADEEVLYTLVPSAEKEYGLDDALKNVTYTIMNADSAFIIEGTYKFSNGKYGEANGTPAEFYMIAVDTDSTFVLYDETNNKKLVVSTQYKTISAEDLDARNDMFIVKPQSAPASYMSLPKHVRLNGADGNSIAINSKNQGVAVREGDELKAAYGVEDLTFWLDTAAYDNADPFKYYITRGVKATEETAASRLFMYNAVDSTVSKLNKEYYTYGTATRIIFRTAEVFVKDTLFVPTMDATAKIDTVSFAKGESADGLKHAVKAGINNFQFSFEFAGEAEGQYNIVCRDAKNTNPSYVHNINGVLAMGAKEDALVVAIEDAEAPTANEGVEVSGVTVIAGNGNVTIAGAAGKKVVITNILGQTVANTVITSDNAAIAAPQGVVVVAVEGEDAIKAIVK